MKTTLAIALLVLTCDALAYDDCTKPYRDGLTDHLETLGYGMNLTITDPGCMAERRPSNPDPNRYLRELEEQHYRDEVLELMHRQDRREVNEVEERNALRWCAPYNRGCAQELYGNGYE